MRPNALIIGILGLWVIAAGIIGLGEVGNVWNGWIIGIIVAILGFTMASRARIQGIITGILGLWLIATTFIPELRIDGGARFNDIVVGTIIAIAAFSTPSLTRPSAEIRRAA